LNVTHNFLNFLLNSFYSKQIELKLNRYKTLQTRKQSLDKHFNKKLIHKYLKIFEKKESKSWKCNDQLLKTLYKLKIWIISRTYVHIFVWKQKEKRELSK